MQGKAIHAMYPEYSYRNICRHMTKSSLDDSGDQRINNKRIKQGKRKMVKYGKKRKENGAYKSMPVEMSVYLRYLHQDAKIPICKLAKRFPKYPRSSIKRHAKKGIDSGILDKRKNNKGRPPVLSDRDKRRIISQIPKLRKDRKGDFTMEHIREASSVKDSIGDSTVRRVMQKEGYRFRDKLRKGVLTEKDVKLRLKFAKYVKAKLPDNIWSHGINFYLDGVGFTYKKNPCENARRTSKKTYRKENEGCSLYCTAAGSREGDGGKVAKFMVTIAYNKGVTMCEEFKQKLNGESFATFVRNHFPTCFEESPNPDDKVFLQDGDPSQNSAMAMNAVAEVGAEKFAIPPRSPDLNPIENLFHLCKRRLKKDAIENQIEVETYDEFIQRIKKTILSTKVVTINNLIDSMNKRIDLIIKAKGQRIKY